VETDGDKDACSSSCCGCLSEPIIASSDDDEWAARLKSIGSAPEPVSPLCDLDPRSRTKPALGSGNETRLAVVACRLHMLSPQTTMHRYNTRTASPGRHARTSSAVPPCRCLSPPSSPRCISADAPPRASRSPPRHTLTPPGSRSWISDEPDKREFNDKTGAHVNKQALCNSTSAHRLEYLLIYFFHVPHSVHQLQAMQ